MLTYFEAYRNVFLLVDALDESPKECNARQYIFEYLIRLSQKTQNVKFFITSRELPNIRATTEILGALPFAIASRFIDIDIRRYIAT